MDCGPPGSSVHGIPQARVPEWVALPSSRGSSWNRDRTQAPCIAGRFFTAQPPGKPLSLPHPKSLPQTETLSPCFPLFLFISLLPSFSSPGELPQPLINVTFITHHCIIQLCGSKGCQAFSLKSMLLSLTQGPQTLSGCFLFYSGFVFFVFFFCQTEFLSVGLLQLCNFNTNSFYLECQLAHAEMCP